MTASQRTLLFLAREFAPIAQPFVLHLPQISRVPLESAIPRNAVNCSFERSDAGQESAIAEIFIRDSRKLPQFVRIQFH